MNRAAETGIHSGDWLGGLDSNQDNQIQNLMYCQLYDLPTERGQQKRAARTTLNYCTGRSGVRQPSAARRCSKIQGFPQEHPAGYGPGIVYGPPIATHRVAASIEVWPVGRNR